MHMFGCKILEHIICSSIYTHLEENKILTDVQHGFRKRRSCETQLTITVDDLAQILNSTSGQADAIYSTSLRLLIRCLTIGSVKNLPFMVFGDHL